MIHVYWADVVPGMPWWAGPVTRGRPRTVYWQPLSDLVERRVDAAVDTSAWGSEVMVELTVPSRLSSEIAVMPGFAVVQLALPTAVNQSRDVELVVTALEDGVHGAVERVARRLGVRHVRTSAEPPSVDHPLRLSTLAGQFGGTIALVSPLTWSDEFMASLKAEEVRWEGHEGWRVVRSTAEIAGRPVSDVDFSAVDVPVVLDDLSADPGVALIVVGKDFERLTGWLPTGLAGRVSVMGRDNGSWWAAIS